MAFQILKEAEKFGFIIEGLGAHSGRTMMLVDFQRLISSCDSKTSTDGYGQAIIDDNVLLKKTGAARKESFSRLRRLYGLNQEILLFRVLRLLWNHGTDNQALLVLLYAIARDPVLRTSADLIIDTPVGITLGAPDFSKAVEAEFSGQLTKNTLASIGRNIASSWTQSGHLIGRSKKERIAVSSSPIVVTFALFLGYLAGIRGEKLFYSSWIKLLDTSQHQLHSYAQVASQQGWLKYKKVGQITEISFDYLLEGEAHE